MSHIPTIFVLFSVLFSLTLAQQCFQEQDGRVVIQAENVDLSGTKFVKESGGGRTWVRWTGPNLSKTPEPRGDLIYKFTCTPGTKKIFIMSSRPDNGKEDDKQNDIFVRFNDGPYQKLYTQFGPRSGIWKYSEQFDVDHKKFAPTFNCKSGENLLYLAGRSENFMMDFIALVPGNVNGASLSDNLPETPCGGSQPRSPPTTEAPPTTMMTEPTTTTTMTAPEVTPAPREMPSFPEPPVTPPMGEAEPVTETPKAEPRTMEMPKPGMPGSMEEKPMGESGSMEEKPMGESSPFEGAPVPVPSPAPSMNEETNMQPEVFPLPSMEEEAMVDPMMGSYEPEMSAEYSAEYTPMESYEMTYESAEPETHMKMNMEMGMEEDYTMPKINRIAMPNEPAELKACDKVKVMFSYTASRDCAISGVVRDAAGGVVAIARKANVQPGVGMVELDIAIKQRVVPGGQYYFEGLMHGKKDKMMDAVVKTDKVFAVRC